MNQLSLEQTAEYLEMANIQTSLNLGFAILHTGKNAVGADFVLLNDFMGESVVTEAL